MGAKKNFVIDTNVILHDYNCLKNFQENDIYLPIVVLEELDKFKKGNEQINFNAREFVRELDLITDDNLFTKGAPLGEGLGRLFVVAGMVDSPRVRDSFPERIPDHQILSVVDWLSTKKPKMKTILVTKDVNLRMKARSIGLLCEDYINDKVINVDIFEKSNEVFEGIDPALIDRIYSSKVAPSRGSEMCIRDRTTSRFSWHVPSWPYPIKTLDSFPVMPMRKWLLTCSLCSII